MAFGDKLPDLPVFTTMNVPLPVGKPKMEAVACCDDTYNFAVEHGTGVPFCLKCRKLMTVEHFNIKLNEYVERMKANR